MGLVGIGLATAPRDSSKTANAKYRSQPRYRHFRVIRFLVIDERQLGAIRWTFPRSWVTVVWSDRYRRRRALPSNRGTGTGKRTSARAIKAKASRIGAGRCGD